LQMVFDFSDPGSVSLRTSKDISRWGCPTSSKTWQEWVTERRGAYSARLKSVHRTSGSGCSSWPTVRHEENWQGHGSTQSYAENGANKQVNYRYNKQGEKVFLRKGTFDITLTTAVMAQNWPSPVASEVRQGFQDRSRGMKGSQESLTTAVVKQHGPAVPASSSTDGSRRGSYRLNARWCETLMGLPIGWTMPSCASPVTIEQTSCGYSATVLSRQQHTERFAHSSKS
jgi:hypothetical protein